MRTDDDDEQVRTVKLTPRMLEILDAQKQAFIAKFGREWGPNDLVFFDPDGPNDVPRPISLEKIELNGTKAMLTAGTPDHLIYAWIKTGRILTDETYRQLSPEDQIEWDDAVNEFIAMSRQQKRAWRRDQQKRCCI
jgi:hypothetical protein